MNIDRAIHNEVDTDITEIKNQIEETWNKLIHLEHNLIKLNLYRRVANLHPQSNDRQLHLSQTNSGSGAAGSESLDDWRLSISERGISVSTTIEGTLTTP